MTKKTFKVGDTVVVRGVATHSAEYDYGDVIAVDGDQVTVAWALAEEVYTERTSDLCLIGEGQ